MKRTAYIARTAFDLTHGNHIGAPEFGIVSLSLVAGGKSSKWYLPDDAPKPGPGPSGSDDFHFAPEKETIQIAYEIDDLFAMIKSAKLEMFKRFSETALWTLDLTKLGDDAYSHGKHQLKWDGRVTKDATAAQAGTDSGGTMQQDLLQFDADKTIQADFPDGYVTIGDSPYKFKLTVTDKKDAGAGATVATAWTYYHILLKKIDLELGPKKALPPAPTGGKPDLDALVYDDNDADALNGNLPAKDAMKKVFLLSNIYKNSNGQMHNHTDFTSYRDRWGDGPNIPVFAKLWVRDSTDAAVEAPKALGKVKFMWDAEDIAENKGSVYAGHHAKAKIFVDSSTNYDKDTTKPKGDNCHKDRGGKRGDDTKTVFPKQTGYGYGFGGSFDSDAQQDTVKDRVFPFKVEPCTTRKWSSYSYAWTKGALASKTGVLFQPCRMAGDAYKLTVYLAWDKKLDTGAEKIILDADDPLAKVNPDIKKETGTFEVWRRLNFVNYVKKNNSVTPNFTVATFQDYYKQAFVQVKYTAGAATFMTKADYDSRVTTALTGRDWYVLLMVPTTPSQYDAGNFGINCATYAAFKTAVKTQKSWNDTQLNSWLTPTLATEALYNAYLSNISSDILTKVCEGLMSPDDGINLFQFNEHYSLATAVGGSRLNGFAPGAAVGPHKGDPTNTQCFFVLCAGPTNYGSDSNRPEQTVAHEIGHCLFMAHAPVQTATDEANKQDATVHDKDFNNCTMSYNYDHERKWCGFCLFRLRGWDRDQLKNDATQNKKP